MPALRFALAQINVTVGDLSGNAEKIARTIALAREQSADVVAFPELALCGYPPEDLLLKPHFVSNTRSALRRLYDAAQGIVVVVGFADRGRGGVHNAAGVLAGRRFLGVYHKMLLPNYGVFDEKRYFVPGERPVVLRIGAVCVALTICEDIWHQPGPAERGCAAGAQAVLNISASPYHAGKLNERTSVVRELARRCGTPVCYVNLVGGQDELVFDGASLIVDQRGRLIARAKQFEEQLLVADVEVPARRARSSAAVTLIEAPVPKATQARAPVEPSAAKPLARWAEVYGALVLGTRDYVRKNGFKKVALGLSGGIDSALTAAIAVDALGREDVVGVTMPSVFSSAETQSDARVVAENLGIRFLVLPIRKIHESYLESLAGVFQGTEPDIAEENIQARIRGNLLMALSNKFGWLVLTTGNKSETSVGYCTLYGDMAGGFAVIKDVPKTWVYELSAWRNAQGKRPVIPLSVIERVPTAELRPNQTDQDSLPPYNVLDRIVDAYVEHDLSGAQVVRKGIDPETVDKVVRLIDRSEYKRRQAPPGVKITPRAFGRDRRMPITNKYRH